MTTNTVFTVFAYYNEPKVARALPMPEDDAGPSEEIGLIREEAWTDGYLTGRQALANETAAQTIAAKLLTSLHDLETTAAQEADTTSLAIADLLANMVIAAASDDWSSHLPGRVRMVAERIKPTLSKSPEFTLRDADGVSRSFADLTDLSRAIEANPVVQDVTIRWHWGEAMISRTELLKDLREAIFPLSAGLVNEQNARQQT